ncbi:MAG: hypothetical protein LAO78_01235 [Acidobacteriia bacterium]|nr:hypothetical protein [Terriglobia bacterium]
MIDPKDKIALAGIIATFLVALSNLLYSIFNNRRAAYINTVTTSRLKWIDSLRDKVAAFIAVSVRVLNPEIPSTGKRNISELLQERDTLMHQIILHLNPHDVEDQSIQQYVEQSVRLASSGVYTPELQKLLVDLRNATQAYLKKEWTRVKRESKAGEVQ